MMNMDAIVEGIANLGLEFIKLNGFNNNQIISPTSILSFLNLVHLGTESDGSIHEELNRLLGYVRLESHSNPHQLCKILFERISLDASKSELTFISVNKVLANREKVELKREYKALAEQHYEADCEEFREQDVQGTATIDPLYKRINQWIEKTTSGNLCNVLDPAFITFDTLSIIANVSHFKGLWQDPFNSDLTRKRTFFQFGLDTHCKEVDFMYQKRLFRYVNLVDRIEQDEDQFDKLRGELDCRVIQLQFRQKLFSILIFLPNSFDGLQRLIENLDGARLESVLGLLKVEELKLYLPKFEFLVRYEEADKTLAEMGLGRMFNPSLEFSEMFEVSKPSCISSVLHVAKIKVDEEGAEASAATISSISLQSIQAPIEVFDVDHPFMFIIIHNETFAPLFMGTVTNFD